METESIKNDIVKQNVNFCPICHCDTKVYYENLYDDRYGYPGHYTTLKCKSCGHVFLKANFSDKQIIDLYSHYYPRRSFSLDRFQPAGDPKGFKYWFNGEFRAYCLVPKNVRVLDIGCGFGETVAYHHARGCDAYGIEADDNILRVAQKYNLKLTSGLFSADKYPKAYFDYVTMDQVLEHVQQPAETLQGIHQVLKKDGKLIVAIPYINSIPRLLFRKKWMHWHTPYHLHFYTDDSIAKLAKNNGFIVAEKFFHTNSDWLYYQFLQLVFPVKPNETSPYWASYLTHPELSKKQKLFYKFTNFIYKLKGFHILQRILDLLRISDNKIYVLQRSEI